MEVHLPNQRRNETAKAHILHKSSLLVNLLIHHLFPFTLERMLARFGMFDTVGLLSFSTLLLDDGLLRLFHDDLGNLAAPMNLLLKDDVWWHHCRATTTKALCVLLKVAFTEDANFGRKEASLTCSPSWKLPSRSGRGAIHI